MGVQHSLVCGSGMQCPSGLALWHPSESVVLHQPLAYVERHSTTYCPDTVCTDLHGFISLLRRMHCFGSATLCKISSRVSVLLLFDAVFMFSRAEACKGGILLLPSTCKMCDTGLSLDSA